MSPAMEYVNLVINILLVVGVLAAILQVKEAKKALKAQVFMKLIDEWRDKEIYSAMIYINNLRDKWKAYPINEWPELAKKWVLQHKDNKTDLTDSNRQELQKEWEMRRSASQFLSKMGSMIETGYLSENDFFGVVPEVGRQLVVLIYIERAIQEYWTQKEQNPIAHWDKPFPKWEFNKLWAKYQKWYQKHGHDKLVLDLPDWSNIPKVVV